MQMAQSSDCLSFAPPPPPFPAARFRHPALYLSFPSPSLLLCSSAFLLPLFSSLFVSRPACVACCSSPSLCAVCHRRFWRDIGCSTLSPSSFLFLLHPYYYPPTLYHQPYMLFPPPPLPSHWVSPAGAGAGAGPQPPRALFFFLLLACPFAVLRAIVFHYSDTLPRTSLISTALLHDACAKMAYARIWRLGLGVGRLDVRHAPTTMLDAGRRGGRQALALRCAALCARAACLVRAGLRRVEHETRRHSLHLRLSRTQLRQFVINCRSYHF